MTKIDIFYQEVRKQIKNYYRYNKEPDMMEIYNLAWEAGVPPTMVEEVIQDTMVDMSRLYGTDTDTE